MKHKMQTITKNQILTNQIIVTGHKYRCGAYYIENRRGRGEGRESIGDPRRGEGPLSKVPRAAPKVPLGGRHRPEDTRCLVEVRTRTQEFGSLVACSGTLTNEGRRDKVLLRTAVGWLWKNSFFLLLCWLLRIAL